MWPRNNGFMMTQQYLRYYYKTCVSVFFLISIFCVMFCDGTTNRITERHQQQQGGGRRVTIDDLLHTKYPTKISNDLDVDICKAGGFMGDIALPNIDYEREYLQLKKDVIEGLQVEEEGLTDYLRMKLKQVYIESSTEKPKLHYNDPVVAEKETSTVNDPEDANNNNSFNTKQSINLKSQHHVQSHSFTRKFDNKKFTPNDREYDEKLNRMEPSDEKKMVVITNNEYDELTNRDNRRELQNYTDAEMTFESTTTTTTILLQQDKVTTKKRGRRRHKRRRQRFRKRKLNNLYSTTTNSGGSTAIGLKSSTGTKMDDIISIVPVTPTTIDSKNQPETLLFNTLAKSQSLSSSSATTIASTTTHNGGGSSSSPTTGSAASMSKPPTRVTRSITTPSTTLEERHRQQYLYDNNYYHPPRASNQEMIEIPVHEFEDKFETPRKLPAKIISGGHNDNIHQNFVKALFHDSIPTVNNRNHETVENRHLRVTRAATARKERIWDYGVIPYEIDGNFSGAHKALFKQAMRHWENSTCVKFVERVPEEHPNYIIFTERPCGCCSFVGKRGNGAQAISIGKNCDKFGIVVHELGHVVGFWHEHTRPDRDHHVQIFREHILSGQEYNFNKLTEEEVNSLGLPYDYDSIMHYAKNTFSRGSYLDTIAPQENKIRGKPVPEIGQRLRLSQGDIAQTNLLYKCYKCGRTFQENAGSFSSPNYPNPAKGDGDKCEWRITATHGERIVLNITDLDIYKSNDCGSDYIEIRDGYWHKSPMLGRFCGSGRLTEPIVSTGSRMLVTYITSSKQAGHRGFTANYEAICGGELEVTTGGHLESPNYPEDYLKNKECIWKLSVPPNFTVALRFQSFEIENHDNCVYDYVEVVDGFEPDSPIIGRFCGYKVPPDIKSTSNHLMVKFFSDSSVQKAGFSATFMKEYNECNQTNHGCEHDCINTLGSYECACRIGYELHSDGKHCEAACGGIYDSPNGTITSPSFPALYPENKNCIWEIIAPPQYRITLNFTHFDLEGNNLYQQECDYDSVVVQSKIGDDYKKHGTFCGTVIPDIITSEGNSLRIVFSSDFTVQKSGFAAIYFTDMDECAVDNGGCQHECSNTVGSYKCSCHNGFTLHENGHDCKEGGCKFEVTAPHGEIQSPNYPDYYPSRKDCVWHFVTTPGHRIKLVFEKFEMEPHPGCAYDHIVLYDGDSPESRTLGRYCGAKIPPPIIASGNQMFMVFQSDASVQRKGFRAVHSTACGGILQATTTVKHFYSHSRYGDYNYANRMDCEWTIQPLGRRSIILTFLTFELEDEVTNCGYDYVSIAAGLDSSGYKYGKFCGTKMPSIIISNGEPLVVRFRSDDSIVSKGFSASYVAGDDHFDITDESEMDLEAKVDMDDFNSGSLENY